MAGTSPQGEEQNPAGLPLTPQDERGKSGQRRASYFLTESYLQRWSNVEENNRHNSYGKRGKGEKVG